EPFPKFMSDTVLKPMGMTNSTYEQPLPQAMSAAAATGYYATGREVPGRWHIYPEMAAAGLWTTPSDLARFAIGVQEAAAGRSGQTLSPTMGGEDNRGTEGYLRLGRRLAGKRDRAAVRSRRAGRGVRRPTGRLCGDRPRCR